MKNIKHVDDRENRFRVAVRRFESAMAKQWEQFETEARSGMQLELVPMNFHQLFVATLGSPCRR